MSQDALKVGVLVKNLVTSGTTALFRSILDAGRANGRWFTQVVVDDNASNCSEPLKTMCNRLCFVALIGSSGGQTFGYLVGQM